MSMTNQDILNLLKSDIFERKVLQLVFGDNSDVLKAHEARKKKKETALKAWDEILAYMDRYYTTDDKPNVPWSIQYPEPSRSGQPWTDGEVAQLEREVGKLVAKLAGMYGRTPKAIESKCRALGLLGYKH